MKFYAVEKADGSINVYHLNGQVEYQLRTASEQKVKPRTRQELEAIVRGSGNEIVEWREEMTDVDKLKSLLDEWEVPYEEEDNVIMLEADAWRPESAKVTGYDGFVTHVTFDENGGFRQIGIWE